MLTCLEERKECTGCRACEMICPKNAIKMVKDAEGFIYPEIDKDKCINCGLCYKTCQRTTNTELNNTEVYAVKIKDEKIIMKSSSGGAFSAIAQLILNHKGVVCGCYMDENFETKNIFIDNEKDLQKLRGSKYIQSDVKDTYKESKKYLESGKYVLYTGTPCQITGLKKFLNKEYDKLVTIDLICHGVPSNQLFQKYINYLEKKNNYKILSYKFRDKSKFGWASTGSYTYKKDNKIRTKYIFPENDYYYNLYCTKQNIYRECCYDCKYANANRVGDITIADFWGIEKYYSNFNYSKGASLVIINNKKGKDIFNQIKKSIDYEKCKIEHIIKENANFTKSTERPQSREYIYDKINKEGFESVEKEIKLRNFIPSLKRKIPKKIKKIIKKLIKNER